MFNKKTKEYWIDKIKSIPYYYSISTEQQVCKYYDIIIKFNSYDPLKATVKELDYKKIYEWAKSYSDFIIKSQALTYNN